MKPSLKDPGPGSELGFSQAHWVPPSWWPTARGYMCTHTYIHTQHTYIHAHTCICMHTFAHPNTHIHTYPHPGTHIHTCMHTYTRMCTHMHTPTCTHAHVHAHTRTCIHTRMHAHTYTHRATMVWQTFSAYLSVVKQPKCSKSLED